MFELSPKFGMRERITIYIHVNWKQLFYPILSVVQNVCGMYGFSKPFTLNIYKIGLIQTSMNLKETWYISSCLNITI